MKKVQHASEVQHWEQIPNVGKAMARDFERLGLRRPQDLAQQNAWDLYQQMCVVSGQRQDPCVLDTYLAVIDFMRGGAVRTWWSYTAERKMQYPKL